MLRFLLCVKEHTFSDVRTFGVKHISSLTTFANMFVKQLLIFN